MDNPKHFRAFPLGKFHSGVLFGVDHSTRFLHLSHGFGQIRKPAAQNLRRCKQRKERFVLKYTKISEDSTKHRAVGEGDGVAVEVDRAAVGQTRDRAVAGERPYAAGLDAHDRVVR